MIFRKAWNIKSSGNSPTSQQLNLISRRQNQINSYETHEKVELLYRAHIIQFYLNFRKQYRLFAFNKPSKSKKQEDEEDVEI